MAAGDGVTAGFRLSLLDANQATASAPHAARIVGAQSEATAGAAWLLLGDDATAVLRLQAAMDHWAAFEQDGEPLPRALASRREAARQELGSARSALQRRA